MTKEGERVTLSRRIKSMLAVDFRRMFTTPLAYILIGICLVIPVLIFVMTGLMEGTVTVDPATGEETVMTGFAYVWQMIGTLGGTASDSTTNSAGMDLVSMCNINLVFFIVAVLVCLFIGEDFRSGYAKNLFTVRAKRIDYVLSKITVCYVGAASMLSAFFVGTLLGGAIMGLPFAVEGITVGGLIACMVAKLFLLLVFVSIFVLMSILAKSRTWLAILLSLGVGMLLFMMIPSLTPLNATIVHIVLCLAGGGMFAVGLGAVGVVVLRKTSIV